MKKDVISVQHALKLLGMFKNSLLGKNGLSGVVFAEQYENFKNGTTLKWVEPAEYRDLSYSLFKELMDDLEKRLAEWTPEEAGQFLLFLQKEKLFAPIELEKTFLSIPLVPVSVNPQMTNQAQKLKNQLDTAYPGGIDHQKIVMLVLLEPGMDPRSLFKFAGGEELYKAVPCEYPLFVAEHVASEVSQPLVLISASEKNTKVIADFEGGQVWFTAKYGEIGIETADLIHVKAKTMPTVYELCRN